MKKLTVISFGAGVQSTAILHMSVANHARCPRADVAIFADTQCEPAWVYENLRSCEKWSDIPIVTVTSGNLAEDVVRRHADGGRFAALPVFTEGADGRPSMLRRQCTREYKIDAIKKEVRRMAGVKPGEWAKGKVEATMLLGISVDEVRRAAPSRDEWMSNSFPLLDARMRRSDCVAYLERNGIAVPRKSSCLICPFHSDAYWQRLRDDHPDEFQRACRFDTAIRNMTASGIKRPVFLHRSLQPLEQVDFADQMSLWDAECSGHCGV